MHFASFLAKVGGFGKTLILFFFLALTFHSKVNRSQYLLNKGIDQDEFNPEYTPPKLNQVADSKIAMDSIKSK